MILLDTPSFKVMANDPESNKLGSGSDSKDTEAETSVSFESDLLAQVNRTNDLLTGVIFFMGLLFGLIGMIIFWTRFKGD